MLVEGDIGFWFRLVGGVIVILFPPAVVLVVRHKWRGAVARREEIKRLCFLASEEAALAELETKPEYGYGYRYEYGYDAGYAKGYSDAYGSEDVNGKEYGYDGGVSGDVEVQRPAVASVPKEVFGVAEVTMAGRSSQKLMHSCAFCSGPTNQKCSRCKSIYYCSGKCQIAHWRKGHKDDCQPYKLTQMKESVMTSQLKVSKPDESVRDDNSSAAEENSRAKAAEISSNRPDILDTGLSAVYTGSDNLEVEHLQDDNQNNQTSKSMGNFKDLSAANGFHVSHSSHSSSRSSRHLPAKVNDFQTASANNTQISSDDKDKDSTPSTLSGLDVSRSVESSSCEPSLSTPGFWEGELVRGRCKADPPKDSSPCFSNEIAEPDMSGSHVTPHATAKTSSLVRSRQTTTETKKPTNLNTHIVEEIEACVSKEPLKSTVDGSSHVRRTDSSFKPIPQPEKLGPSTLNDEVEFITKGSGVSSMNKLESREPNSVTSGQAMDPLASSTRRHVEVMNAVKGGKTHSATSFENSGPDHNAKHPSRSLMRKVVDVAKTSTSLRQHTRGSGTEMLTKYKGLFPYDLFVKLYNWKDVEYSPSGFINCGNSCYANVVLQCLASTPPLTSYLLKGLHSKSCKKRDWCFTCELESLMLKAKDGFSPLSPIRIISHLQNIGSHLRNGREEDAHEFLRYAIDTMQSTCLTEAGVRESVSLEEGTTIIGLTFGGIIRSRIECMKCGRKSERQERMMDLTVEINGDIRTLEEALKKYTSDEILDGDNKYSCGRCNSVEKAKKKLKVLDAPNVLTIALKRYQSGKFGKLNKTVKFPKILNLAPYICGTSDKSPIYGLYGVIVHLDTMNSAESGHYVCYVKNTQNQWFMLNDSVVEKVNIEMVLTKDAYMLLYARCSPRAPRFLRSSLIPRDPRNANYHVCKSRSQSRDSWGVSTGEVPLNDEACLECTNTFHASLMSRATNPDYGSSNDNSSLFSESGSYGTDSSNKDSASTDDHLDYGGMNAFWNNNSGRSSSDSDTSSSSSSPSPLSLKQSPLADADRYASKHMSKNSAIFKSSSSGDLENTNHEEEYHFRHPDSSKHLKQFSSSSRETEANRLGRINPFDKLKLGLPFRKSTNDRQGQHQVTY